MITEFKGKTRWLSNFTLCPISLDGRIYPSTEHAYMSQKNHSIEWKEFCSSPSTSCIDVKKAGSKIELREDWENIKFSVMESILRQKFNKQPFKDQLILTGSEEIQEGNTWGDTLWGIDLNTGKGQNMLGKLIMKIRNELINEN